MTIGEHEFKYGADLFLEAAKEAGFPFLAANYRAQNADLNSLIEDQIIREYSGFNVGVFGIGIDLNSQIENGLEKEINTLDRSEEHTSELQSRGHLVCRLLLE